MRIRHVQRRFDVEMAFRFYCRGYTHTAIARSNLARKVKGLKSRFACSVIC